jgi:hypothetical protein
MRGSVDYHKRGMIPLPRLYGGAKEYTLSDLTLCGSGPKEDRIQNGPHPKRVVSPFVGVPPSMLFLYLPR